MRIIPLVLVVALAGCNSSNGTPTAPTPTPAPTPANTRIITVSGNLAFGDTDVGTSPIHTFTIANSGNTAMTVTDIQAVGGTGITGWQANPMAAIIPAGGSIPATLKFSPTTTQFYSTILTVIGDQTSGNATINVSGSGVNNTPLFRASGIGDTIFDLPASVQKLHIVATYAGNGANFVVTLGPASAACGVGLGPGCRWLANELMGTAFDETIYDTIVPTAGGGQVVIAESSGVQWTMTELRP